MFAGKSEDCLFLNIWAPQWKIEEVSTGAGTKELLPVIFWVHGGGYVAGSGTNKVTSGISLTAQNVLLVSINYRLGLFGFWKHKALRESGESVTSNFGLHDQRLALEWVQENIAFFGGDPNSVTFLGESSGGISMLSHLTSKRMREDYKEKRPKLFHRAWITSAVILETPYLEEPESDQVGAEWAAAKGCYGDDVVECMRRKEASELVDPMRRWSAFDHDSTRMTVYATADVEFPLIPVALREGQFDPEVPIVVGTSWDDGSLFAWFSFPVDGPEKSYLDYMINRTFSPHADSVFQLYPSHKYASEYWRYSELLTDSIWTCPAQAIASAIALQSLQGFPTSARRYVINFRYNDSSDQFGIFHCGELPLLFENPSGNYLFPRYFTKNEKLLARRFASLFIRFARNQLTEEEWPTYTNDATNYLLVGNGSVDSTELSFHTGFRTEPCKFWLGTLPRGLRSFPKGLHDQEGWKSYIFNSIFFISTYYENYLTQETGIIVLLISLLVASLLGKLLSMFSSFVSGSILA